MRGTISRLLHLAEKQLTDLIGDSQFTSEQSQEFREAAAGEKQAYDEYTARRQKRCNRR